MLDGLLLPLILISLMVVYDTKITPYQRFLLYPEKKSKKSTRVYLTSFRVVKPWIHVILRSSYFIISEQLHYQYLLEKLCMYINLVADFRWKGVWGIIYENKKGWRNKEERINNLFNLLMGKYSWPTPLLLR